VRSLVGFDKMQRILSAVGGLQITAAQKKPQSRGNTRSY